MMIQPPSCLLAGPAGSGKTTAIATQLKYGLRVFVIVTEPDGVSSLLDSCERQGIPIDKLHWALCLPASAGWLELEDMIRKVSSMDQKMLSEEKNMGKMAFRDPMLKFLRNFSNFHCDRTGLEWGDFTKWDDSCSLNIDSLTGWCMMAFGVTVGYKPTPNPGEWGIAQNVVFNLLTKINSDRRCFFNVTAHIEKEMDELSGVRRVMVSAIGSKLAPKIPPFFSEVIKCERSLSQGKATFTWSTVDTSMDLKNRSLPMAPSLPADFGPVIEGYRKRLEKVRQSTGSLGLSVPQFPQSEGVKPLPTPSPQQAVRPPTAPMTPSSPAAKKEPKP